MSFISDTLKRAINHPGVIAPTEVAVGAGAFAYAFTTQGIAREALCNTLRDSTQAQTVLNLALTANDSVLECTKSALLLVSRAYIAKNIAIGAAIIGAGYLAYRVYKIITQPPQPPQAPQDSIISDVM